MSDFFKKSSSILGMNSRNLDFIRPFNLASAKRIADDKLFCKRTLIKNEISTSKLIAKISSYEELENFDWQSLPSSFALKPNRGFGGEGIIVVYGKKKPARNASFNNDLFIQNNTPSSNKNSNSSYHSDAGGDDLLWIKADSSTITVSDLKNHIHNILDGSFSLSGVPDIAFFEERVQLLKLFKPYAYKGIPDVRVIVFNKVPVMAMLRLPTEASGGKANLQQGAIGVGIDLATGTTTNAIQGKGTFVDHVPGTRLLLSGLKIPYWNDILRMAVRAQEISNLGFLGADIAIDKEKGPLILELNARPGLSIQVANLAGLKGRLLRVSGLKIKTLEKGVRVGMDLFGGEIEEGLEGISGRKIIGTVEKVKLIGKDGKEVEVEAKIDTGAYSSSIDTALAKQLGFEETLIAFEKIDTSSIRLVSENEKSIKKDFLDSYGNQVPDLADVAIVFSASGSSMRPIIKIGFVLDNQEVLSLCNIVERKNLKYPMIIGRKNLKKFLIDVNK